MSSSVSSHTPRPFFLDLEVDSVPEGRGEPFTSITQISVIDPHCDDKVKRAFEAFVKPPKELRRKKEEMDFSHGHVGPKKYSLKKVWPELKKFINSRLDGNRFAVIVAHNGIEHDFKVLKENLARIGEALPKYWKPFDSLYFAKAARISGHLGLTDLCHTFDVKIKKHHTAYYDSKMLMNVFYKMIEGADLRQAYGAMVDSHHPYKQLASLIKTHEQAVLVIFDYEATGLLPKEGERKEMPRVVEIGAYMPHKDSDFSCLVNPGCPIPRDSTDIHGITDEDVREADDFKIAWTKCEDWMNREIGNTARKVIVLAGHNIWGYDLKVLDSECDRVGLEKKRWKSLDTLALSRHMFRGCKGVSHKLQDLRKMMHISEDHAHRALGDVKVNWQVLQRFFEGADTKRLNEALLSGHPILETGAVLRETGSFNPKDYIGDEGGGRRGPSAASSSSSSRRVDDDDFLAVAPTKRKRGKERPEKSKAAEMEEEEEDFLAQSLVKKKRRKEHHGSSSAAVRKEPEEDFLAQSLAKKKPRKEHHGSSSAAVREEPEEDFLGVPPSSSSRRRDDDFLSVSPTKKKPSKVPERKTTFRRLVKPRAVEQREESEDDFERLLAAPVPSSSSSSRSGGGTKRKREREPALLLDSDSDEDYIDLS